MEKRALVAIVLSVAFMYAYSYFMPQPQKQNPAAPAAKQAVQASAVGSAPVVPVQGATAAPSVVNVPSVLQDVVVETDLYRAVFSTLGGALKRIELKQYKDVAGPAGKPIVLFSEDQPAHFTLTQTFPGLPIDAAALFTPSAASLSLKLGEQKTLEFVTRSQQGVMVKKIYSFSSGSYTIGLDQQLINGTPGRVEGSMQLVLSNKMPDKQTKDSRFETTGPVTLANNEVVFDKTASLAKEEKSFTKGVQWSAFADKYFINAVLAKNSSIQSVSLRDVNGYLESRFNSNRLAINPGETATIPLQLYFGPKALDQLKAQGNRLEEVIDLGWFSAIAKPLLFALKFLYGYLHNYGLAIIIITVILKLLFFPLTHKSYKSMKEMQKLQPKMQAMKEKYKDDRDAMNKAVMELYKEHKVNPLGGCLPMVVQIPVFFALYKALMFSIELRHAPFYFWITDLSGPDALFSHLFGLPFTLGPLPLVMGATMFIQQKMTPSQMDPVQAKMMLALPVVFTFMFLNFPSGLVLYWLVNNVLTIAQQSYINKSLKEA